MFMPWPVKRWLLRSVFGYEIDATAYIGFSFVMPDKLIMKAHAKIDSFTVCKGLALLHLDERACLGRFNWVTGFPLSLPEHFAQVENRNPALVIGKDSAITKGHIIDCTDAIIIGQFTTVAGFQSQLLTHSDRHCRKQTNLQTNFDRQLLFCRNKLRDNRRFHLA